MTENIKPSEYLKLARQGFINLPAGVCNDLLQKAHNSDGLFNGLYIPESIPQKYHARMHALWTMMVFKILFANATDRYTLMQRHNMVKKALELANNIRVNCKAR